MSSPAPTRRLILGAAPALTIGWPWVVPARSEDTPQGLAEYLYDTKPTAFLAMREGRMLASHGDPARKVSVASVRKSLLGTLFGIAIAEGRVALSDDLAALGIDDAPPSLTAREKTATVADLLSARSGIYHPAAYETRDMREKRPVRGSHPPGTFWYYNNWDFNALGTIYRQRTGEDVFESFSRRIAAPIGMQDFRSGDGRYVSDARSRHPAYVFSLSTRDMLRFGEVVLAGGTWQGRAVVPAGWLSRSLSAHSKTDRGDLGYGYLWWVLDPTVFGPGAGFAAGFGGQFIAVVPRRRLVVVQTVALHRDGGGSTRRFVRMLTTLAA